MEKDGDERSPLKGSLNWEVSFCLDCFLSYLLTPKSLLSLCVHEKKCVNLCKSLETCWSPEVIACLVKGNRLAKGCSGKKYTNWNIFSLLPALKAQTLVYQVWLLWAWNIFVLSALVSGCCEILVSLGEMQCAAEHGIRGMEHSYVSHVVARHWQLVWCPGALCSALLLHTFTIWNGAWWLFPSQEAVTKSCPW